MKQQFELVTAEEIFGFSPELLPAPQSSARIIRGEMNAARRPPMFCWAAEPVTTYAAYEIVPPQWTIDPIHAARLFDVYLTGFSKICMTVEPPGDAGARKVYFADLDQQSGIRSIVSRRAGGERYTEIEVPDDDAGVVRIDEPCAVLYFHLACAFHHSHWIFQALPKIDLLREAGAEVERWVVTDQLPAYQYEAYEALGIPRRALLLRPEHSLYRFRELYACNTWPDVLPRCESVERLIDRYGGQRGGPEKIYVSRYDTPYARHLLNEESIAGVAREEGFEVIIPGQLSLAEEIRIFRHAKVIAGPLGAGLYNAAFSEPGTRILSISDSGYMTTWFVQLATHLGLDYGIVFGNSLMSYEETEKGSHSSWVLDPALFRKALRTLCA